MAKSAVEGLETLRGAGPTTDVNRPRRWSSTYMWCPRSSSTIARLMSSRGVGSAKASRPATTSNDAGLEMCVAAAAKIRSARREGSAVSATDRSSSAAAAASPPRARARPAERSSATAISSSGPGDPSARCHTRRSGSFSGSVASASARCAACRSASGRRSVRGRSHQRVSERHPDADLDEPGVDRRGRIVRDRRRDCSRPATRSPGRRSVRPRRRSGIAGSDRGSSASRRRKLSSI